MSTIVQPATTKQTLARRSKFPGKESGSVSFNLTAIGRQLLKEQASEAKVSNGDYVEMLIRERESMPPIRISSQAKQTGPKGGAKSYFFGKNRGTTTAVCVTPLAHKLLDQQVVEAKMSRGDYVEYLLRMKANLLDESLISVTATEETATEEAMPQITQMPETETQTAGVESISSGMTMDSQASRTGSNTPSSNSFFTQNW